MERVDVLARMLIVLVSQRHSDIVCACFKGLHRMGRHEVLARATLAITQMGRPDIVALVSQCASPHECNTYSPRI